MRSSSFSDVSDLGRRATLGILVTSIAAAVVNPAIAASLPPLSAVFTRLHPSIAPPALPITNASGGQQTLAEYRGKGVVLNICTTWCPPCRAELPTLDRLAKAVAPDGIVVLPVSIDRGGLKVVERFYRQHQITCLPILLDPNGRIVAAFNAPGTPTTAIINRQGRMVALVEGAAQWDAPASAALLCHTLGSPEG